jgi:hypothetical protein
MDFGEKRWQFVRAIVEHAPDDAGVYVLWHGPELVYIGRASHGQTIRSCLLAHKNGERGACTARASHYSWEISSWPSARETELLSQFHRQYQRGPRCNAA